MKNNLILFLVFIFLQACASSPTIIISSVPDGATVSSITEGNNRLIGRTPLKINSRDLGGGQRLTSLDITSEGYQSQQILLARDRGTENYEINIELKKNSEDPKSLDSRNRQEKLAQSIAQATNFINNKRYDEARNLLNRLIVDFPNLSVGYDLLGGLHYLQKDLKASLGYYEKALTINPDNTDTRSMVNRLRGMLQ